MRVNRCFKCAQYGHETRTCTSEIVCYKCGKTGHLAAACEGEIDCGNCRRRNLDSKHSALSLKCPEYGSRLVRVKSRIYNNP